MRLENVIPLGHDYTKTYTVTISDTTNCIEQIESTGQSSISADQSPPTLLLPTLCHPHVHLDKPYLLNSHVPTTSSVDGLVDYSDLTLKSGDFAEALSRTAEAKKRYTVPDLVLRGSQLIAESVNTGVTAIRAFVEVDDVAHDKCVLAGIELKEKFRKLCYIQLCAFAQDPMFNEEKQGPQNKAVFENVLVQYQDKIEVLGSTPYVEGDERLQKQNIEWAIDLALKYQLHLDFHLDYNLDKSTTPMLWHVIETLKKVDWTAKTGGKTVVIGHCSRMTLFSQDDMKTLSQKIHESHLPISFVGLPTSDVFMMGRPQSKDDWGGSRPRGTMQVLEMIRKFDLNACIGINNVGNAFTPWGAVDPLRLASLGVGVYQAGTPEDAGLLFECVSSRAKKAIGINGNHSEKVEEEGQLPLLLVKSASHIKLDGLAETIPARRTLNIADVVWDPPANEMRSLLRGPGKSTTTSNQNL